MKKVILGALLLIGLASRSHAWELTKEDDVVVHSTLTVGALVSTSVIVVSLSSNTWPHQSLGFVNITGIDLEFDKLAASSCTARLGVVNFINTATGSVTWFKDFNNNVNVSNTNNQHYLNYSQFPIRCRVTPGVLIATVTDGGTPYIFSGEKTSGSTKFQTDVALPNPTNIPIAPGLGDIILEFTNNDFTNSASLDYTIHYYSSKK